MKLSVNGEAMTVDTPYLDMLLDKLGYDDDTVATAINGDFVPRSKRKITELKDGDALEVLAPMQGG